MKLLENGRLVAEPDSLEVAVKMIAGLDLSMATVDCDPQDYEVRDDDGNVILYRPRMYIP